MKSRWLELARKCGIDDASAESVWFDLAAAYGADGRFYHNLHHIQYALDIADQLQEVALDFTAVQLAIWFHDVVYDPRRSDNEAQSAAYAERVLRRLGVPDEMLAKVSNLILATKSHEASQPDPNIFVILDADLAILSAPPEQYDAYARAIRQEYSFVLDEQYRVGRTAVLQKFLARSPFYFTEKMQVWGDTAVAENLGRELLELKKRNTEGH
jgi:predicted metal-dependent HD superfamily phosphohydrolase